MLDQRHKDLIQIGDKLYSDRMPLMGWWQETADHFYVERAHFTRTPNLGEDFASHLSTSYPILARRELGDQFSGMLRPKAKQWFSIASTYGDEDDDALRWLQYAARVMKNAMYDPAAKFVRATKETDHDFAAFGNGVLTAELASNRNTLLYRCWHIRDVVWSENADGEMAMVQRKWAPGAKDLKNTFPRAEFPTSFTSTLGTDPFKLTNTRHIVVRSDQYEPPTGGKRWNSPYVSIWLDVENKIVLEETPLYGRHYIIPRWQTVSGSQYAFSPAVIAALPDARLIQAMTLTLLQAGERATAPPMVAKQGIIRSDVDLRADGITWIDKEYDARLGKALEPVEYDHSGLQFGLKMRDDAREIIREAFFLNKIGLPPSEREMTAFETAQRVSEYIRQALPLFEPVEDNYSGGLCEETFGLLMRNGAFGPMQSIPDSLKGENVQFRFDSPLKAAEGTAKGQLFTDTANMLAQAVQIDPNAPAIMDGPTALRDALYGIGVPAKWLHTAEEAAKILQANQQKQIADAALQQVSQGSEIAKNLGTAANQAGLTREAA